MIDYIFEIPGKEPLMIPCEDSEQAYEFATGLLKRENKPIKAFMNDDESQAFTVELEMIDCQECHNRPDWVVNECEVCGGTGKLLKV